MLPLQRQSRRRALSTRSIWKAVKSVLSRASSTHKISPLPEFLLEVVEDDQADGDPGQAAGDVGQVGEGRASGGWVLCVKPPVHSHTHLTIERELDKTFAEELWELFYWHWS